MKRNEATGARALVFLAALAVAGGAAAQEWPNKPVRAVIAFTPGSATDIVGRIVAERLVSLGERVEAHAEEVEIAEQRRFEDRAALNRLSDRSTPRRRGGGGGSRPRASRSRSR